MCQAFVKEGSNERRAALSLPVGWEQRAAVIMNIGWIFLGCALVILAIMAFIPWGKKKRVNVQEGMFGTNDQQVLARFDNFETRPVRRDEIIGLLQAGRKIEAIKRYRADTGAALTDARAAVERIEMEIDTDPGTPGEMQTPAPGGAVPDFLKRDAEALLLSGRKIEAIKRYREQTGLGLRAAKEAVDLLEQELAGSSLAFGRRDARSEEGALAGEEPGEEVRRYLQQGRKIEAIKRYREQTGLGLRAAKEAVDLLEQELRQSMEQN
jgi:ribosomal protein L7/L12